MFVYVANTCGVNISSIPTFFTLRDYFRSVSVGNSGVSTQSAPGESAQFVGRVARLSRNVRQPDHVLANSFAGHKAEPRPGAGEEWLAMTKHDGMDVESILINQAKVGQTPCQVWSGYVDLPIQLGF